MVDSFGDVIAIQQRKVRPACGLATNFSLTPRFGRVNGAFVPARGGWSIFSHTEPTAVALAEMAAGWRSWPGCSCSGTLAVGA